MATLTGRDIQALRTKLHDARVTAGTARAAREAKMASRSEVEKELAELGFDMDFELAQRQLGLLADDIHDNLAVLEELCLAAT